MPRTCPDCHGSGLGKDRKACGTCGGIGEVYGFVRSVRRIWRALLAAAFQ